MKYVAIVEFKNGEVYSEEHNSEYDGIYGLEKYWDHLTESEQKKVETAFVLESDDPDEDSEKHFDGNVVWVVI